MSLQEQVKAYLTALCAGIRGIQLLADALSEMTDTDGEPPTIKLADQSFETARWWIAESRKDDEPNGT